MSAAVNRGLVLPRLLSRMGMAAEHELLYWLPLRHHDYSRFISPADLPAAIDSGKPVCLVLQAATKPIQQEQGPKQGQIFGDGEKPRQGSPRFTLTASDGRHQIEIMVFGQLKWSPWRHVEAGSQFSARGKLARYGRALYLKEAELIPPELAGRILPQYPAKPGAVAAEKLQAAIAGAAGNAVHLAAVIAEIRAAFPGDRAEEAIIADAGIRANSIPDVRLHHVLKAIHLPGSMKEAKWGMEAARRLAVHYVKAHARAANARPVNPRSAINLDEQAVLDLAKRLPFTITMGPHGQRNAIREIVADLAGDRPMNRLLSGDVGAGKTATYGVPAAAAQRAGYRVAILFPNDLLLGQVVAELASWFPEIPLIKVNGQGASREMGEDNPILCGTTALFGFLENRAWRPDFFIVDEQQKFSEEQRKRLAQPHTNYLDATATCVPRTMGMITHGGMDITTLSERPFPRKVHTRAIRAAEKAQAFANLVELVRAGHQIAVIYPLVDDEQACRSVEGAAGLWEKHAPGRVAKLHGRMKEAEKAEIFAGMKAGQFSVLVASTVIEVGVDLPSLKALAVASADRYGVSTLHQMRGRIARGGGEGWFWMIVPDDASEDTIERLQLLESTDSGFRLAELDMDLRGFGSLEADSDNQSGLTRVLFQGLVLKPSDFTGPTGSEGVSP